MTPLFDIFSWDQIFVRPQKWSTMKCLPSSRRLFVCIVEHGLDSHGYLGCCVIRMFSACGSLTDASRAFYRLYQHNVFSCTAMISAYMVRGYADQAIELYYKMIQHNVNPDGHTFVAILKACSHNASLLDGARVHFQVVESSLEKDIHTGNALVHMYGRIGLARDASHVFEGIPEKDVVSWNSLIATYSNCGLHHKVLQSFQKMQDEGIEPDSITFVNVLKVCCNGEALDAGRLIHFYATCYCPNIDNFMWSALIDMYCKCSSVEDARTVFNGLTGIDIAIWNAVIAGYALHGPNAEAIHLFLKMQRCQICPDKVTLVNVMKAISKNQNIQLGKLIHNLAIELAIEMDERVINSVIDMYAKCTSLEDAHKVFDHCEKNDIISWTAIITGYCQIGNVIEALQLFQKMQQMGLKPNIVTWNAIINGFSLTNSADMVLNLFRQMIQAGVVADSTTFVSMLKVCSTSTGLTLHKVIDMLMTENRKLINIYISNTLIDMYVRNGGSEVALKLFGELPIKDLVTWNIMIEGFVHHGYGEEALQFFNFMFQSGWKPDKVTILSTLKACSIGIAPRLGMLIHDFSIEDSCELDTYINSSLIDMYAKCGRLDDAERIFSKSSKQCIETWNSMIIGSALNGKYEQAIDLSSNMGSYGVMPDSISFLNILSSCNHLGLVTDGCNHFTFMKEEWNLRPAREHYNCIADLWGRTGHLKEAHQLLQTMPMKPDFVSWISMLNHCLTYGRMELQKPVSM